MPQPSLYCCVHACELPPAMLAVPVALLEKSRFIFCAFGEDGTLLDVQGNFRDIVSEPMHPVGLSLEKWLPLFYRHPARCNAAAETILKNIGAREVVTLPPTAKGYHVFYYQPLTNVPSHPRGYILFQPPGEHMLKNAQPANETLASSSHLPAGLTPREKDIITQISRGHSNRQTAKKLGISEGTVKVHMKSILKKLGVENRTQAALVVQKSDSPSLQNAFEVEK